ncbi:MAG: RidA family protein [Polyangiaceae bacterium]
MSTEALKTVAVDGWPRPSGYANGVITEGRLLHVAGQIGWDPVDRSLPKGDFVAQFDRALANVVAIVRAAGAEPSSVARMTIYVTDLEAYRSSLAGVGAAWKKHLGRHFPAMALVGVAGLVERDALVEIESVAVLTKEDAR